MVHEVPDAIGRSNPQPQCSFDLVSRWLTQWGQQFPHGTPLSYRVLLLPLHRNGNHWACVAINFHTVTITYMDSNVRENFVGEYGMEYAELGL